MQQASQLNATHEASDGLLPFPAQIHPQVAWDIPYATVILQCDLGGLDGDLGRQNMGTVSGYWCVSLTVQGGDNGRGRGNSSPYLFAQEFPN